MCLTFVETVTLKLFIDFIKSWRHDVLDFTSCKVLQCLSQWKSYLNAQNTDKLKGL